MSFLDMNTALRNGLFGKNPKIWGDPDWKMLIDYVTQGLDCSSEEWDKMTWTPQIWSTLSEPRTKVPPSGKAHIAYLKERSSNADAYIRHMKGMPSFHSHDALSTITESTRQGDDDGESAASGSTEQRIWDAALKRHLPDTIAKLKAEGKAKPKVLGTQKKSRGKASTKAASRQSGAASSK